MAPTISKLEAYKLAKKAGINFKKDFYQHSTSAAGELVAIAKLAGYRKPTSASGSTARYFFAHLERLKNKHGWD